MFSGARSRGTIGRVNQTGPSADRTSLRLTVPPDARFSRYVRERVARFAACFDVPDADALEFLVAVAEAFANAVEHARTPHRIEVRCWIVQREQLMATVVDHGVGFSLDAVDERVPEAFAERGRGLPIMRQYADVFSVQTAPGKGTAVVLGRYVGRRAFSSAGD